MSRSVSSAGRFRHVVFVGSGASRRSHGRAVTPSVIPRARRPGGPPRSRAAPPAPPARQRPVQTSSPEDCSHLLPSPAGRTALHLLAVRQGGPGRRQYKSETLAADCLLACAVPGRVGRRGPLCPWNVPPAPPGGTRCAGDRRHAVLPGRAVLLLPDRTGPARSRGPGRPAGPPCGSGASAAPTGRNSIPIAMLLAEHGVLDRCELLGTDCRADAIERARAGVYDPALLARACRRTCSTAISARSTRPARAGRWCRRCGRPSLAHGERVDRAGAGDVGPGSVPQPGDLSPAGSGRAGCGGGWQASLRPGGVLALGKAERPTGAGPAVPVGPCLYRLAGPREAPMAAEATGAWDVRLIARAGGRPPRSPPPAAPPRRPAGPPPCSPSLRRGGDGRPAPVVLPHQITPDRLRRAAGRVPAGCGTGAGSGSPPPRSPSSRSPRCSSSLPTDRVPQLLPLRSAGHRLAPGRRWTWR